MHPTRIAELLQPFLSPTPNPCHSESGQRPGEEPAVLSPTQLQHISTYIDLLLHWNSRINLTAIRNEEGIVTRHFGESLFAARHLFPKVYPVPPVPPVVKGVGVGVGVAVDVDLDPANDQRLTTNDPIHVADLGSGAGFPGIPIKLWAPSISVTLIESNQKKATFLREVARTLTLTDINIQNVRAQTLPPSTFDVVTLRAVERLPEVLPVAASLLVPQGRLALLISSPQLEAVRSSLPNLSWEPPLPIPQSKSRQLLIRIPEPVK
jgi:16S rRNA (guanine527-N7)-methyltransferase